MEHENIVDQELETAERAASPDRFPPQEHEPDIAEVGNGDLQRIPTTSSSSSGTSSSVSVVREEMRMSRVATGRDLERHPTALSRIQTHRSLHAGTVGSFKSRESRRPLPAFGAGKPYPPMLPDEEDFVVEFDGPNDPMHPQNWPMRRK